MVRPDDDEFARIAAHFGHRPGVRAAIVVDVERIADACGFSVPYYDLVDERSVLDNLHGKQPAEAYSKAIGRNQRSIDGLTGLDPDHPLPKQQ